MPGIHRNQDNRFCGALTTVVGQSNVYVNGKLWAVENDPETHGNGQLVATYGQKNVYINGKHVICAVGDSAVADNALHVPPDTYPKGHSSNSNVY